MLLKNAIIELEITDMDYEGLGISHYENYTIFVRNALVGEVVRARIEKVSKTIAFAKAVYHIKKSPNRITPECGYYDKCGGCNMMHMTYEEEIKMKTNFFINTISKMVKNPPIDGVISSDNPYNYRNKIQLPVGYVDDTFIVGFYQERSHNIIPSSSCMIENENARIVINEVLDLLNESNIYPYNEEAHTGDLRHLVLRCNSKNEFMLILVLRENKPKIHSFISKIKSPLIKSLYINVNPNKTNVILGKEFIHVGGDEYIEEELFGNKFNIHPNSFFQVNYAQMKKLYKCAIDLLDAKPTDTVIDAYSGIGTITLSIAPHVKKIYGIEVVEEAVVNANENKVRNSITNAEFILGKCEEEIMNLVSKEKIDAILMDPPRKGSDQKFLDTVINAKIEKIVYISCGPAALARDLKYLIEHGYELKKITLVDMFSRTTNIESVSLLTRKAE
jgi:23S rRNA (uracil1939-C5)-methyltransferase